MAISATAEIHIQPLGGDPLAPGEYIVDPRLPRGYWWSQVQQAHDASTGLVTITIQPSSAVASSNALWSLESFGYYRSSTIAATQNASWLLKCTPDGATAQFFAYVLQLTNFSTDFGGIAQSPAFDPVKLVPPFWIGSKDATWYLETRISNTNNETNTVSAWGYIWDYIAVRQAGGPLKPIH